MLVSQSFTTLPDSHSPHSLPEALQNKKIGGKLLFFVTGNLTLGEDLSVDLWENFMSGMPGISSYPDVGDYDPDSISFFKPPEGKTDKGKPGDY